jgi:uncharacterized membrane protein (DUF106 family)
MKQFREFLLSLLQSAVIVFGIQFAINGKPNKSFGEIDKSFKEVFEPIFEDEFRMFILVAAVLLFLLLSFLKNFLRNRVITKEIIKGLEHYDERNNPKDLEVLVRKHSKIIRETEFDAVVNDYYSNQDNSKKP